MTQEQYKQQRWTLERQIKEAQQQIRTLSKEYIHSQTDIRKGDTLYHEGAKVLITDIKVDIVGGISFEYRNLYQGKLLKTKRICKDQTEFSKNPTE